MAKINSKWLIDNNFSSKNGAFELDLNKLLPFANFVRKLRAVQDTGTLNFSAQYQVDYIFNDTPISSILTETEEIEDLYHLLTKKRLPTDTRP